MGWACCRQKKKEHASTRFLFKDKSKKKHIQVENYIKQLYCIALKCKNTALTTAVDYGDVLKHIENEEK